MYNDQIDEYVDKVTVNMGPVQRREVKKELKTHILDSAEALAAERNVAVSEAVISEVIRNMGSAETLAEMYPKKKTLLDNRELWDIVEGFGKIAIGLLLLIVILWFVAPGLIGDSLGQISQIVVGFAWVLAIVLAVFSGLYIYRTLIQERYEPQLRQMVKNLEDPASPLKVGLAIAGILVGMAVITLFWRLPLFPANFSENVQVVPVMTPAFASFIPYILVLGALAIVVQILYLVVRQKWIPLLLDAAVTCLNALLVAWVFTVFPFNAAFSQYIVAGIKVMLIFIVLGCLFDAAKKLWRTARVIQFRRTTAL